MPSNIEVTLDRLNEVIELVRSSGHHTALSLLQMAALELQLKGARINDEEFQQFVDELQKHQTTTEQKSPRRGQFVRTAS